MNETLEMIESINKHSREVKKENLKRAELKRKEERKELICEILTLSLLAGWMLYVAWILLNFFAPMFL